MYDYMSVKELLAENGVVAYEIHSAPQLIEESMWFTSYDDFISFIKCQDIKCAFIHVDYFNIDDYIITEELLCNLGIDSSLTESILKAVDKYNDDLFNEDTNFPEHVFVIVVWNNQRFCYLFQNKVLFRGKELLEPEEMLNMILEDFKDEIIETKENREKKIEEQKQSLKTQIINDPEFKVSTNQRLRRNYIINLFKNPNEFDELRKIWVTPSGILMGAAFDFIELIWREFKNK